MNYDAQWEVTKAKTKPHLSLIRKLKRMGFGEERLVCIYKSLTLCQYTNKAPLLASASESAKKEMQAQQWRFFKYIGISAERALSKYNIEPMKIFLDKTCVNIVNHFKIHTIQ